MTIELRSQLREALGAAMKERDATAVAALRSALAAVDNAEAVDAAPATVPPGSATIAGAVGGLGAAEVPRRQLSESDIAGLVQAEISEREAAAAEYDRLGAADRAARLRAEALVLSRVVGAPAAGGGPGSAPR